MAAATDEAEAVQELTVPPFDIPYYLDSSRWTERPPENLLETIHMDEALLPTPEEWEKYFYWALNVISMPKEEIAPIKAKRHWKRTVTVRLCMFVHFVRIGIPVDELRVGAFGTKKRWAAGGRKVFRKAATLLVPVVDGTVDWWCRPAALPSIAGCGSKRTSHLLQTYPADSKEVPYRTAIVDEMRAKFEAGYKDVWRSRQAVNAVLVAAGASMALVRSREERLQPFREHVDAAAVADFSERLDALSVKADLLRQDDVDAGRELARVAEELGAEHSRLFAAANAWHAKHLEQLAEDERLRQEEEERQRELEEARRILEEELRQQREAEEEEAARIAAEKEAKRKEEEEEEAERQRLEQEEEERKQREEEEAAARREAAAAAGEEAEEGEAEEEAAGDEEEEVEKTSEEESDKEAEQEQEKAAEEPPRRRILANFWRHPASAPREEGPAEQRAEKAESQKKSGGLFASIFGSAAAEEDREAEEAAAATVAAAPGVPLTPAALQLREDLRESLLRNPVRLTGELVCEVMDAVERFTAERLVLVANALELDEEQVVDVLQANQQIADRNKRRLERLAAAGRKSAAAQPPAQPVTEEISQSLAASGLG
mmetsp:Transcript_8060/g.33918  ORF Transcript_8060/g.33918 Transcript_8060/m.33918 type:complete len:604 (+) Transcript_8060:27-1838(+)